MAIIMMSRGSYSGGRLLSECVAGHLAYRQIDREKILSKASGCGVSEAALRQALDRPPGFLDRFREERRRYMTLFQACLAEELAGGNVIYTGHLAHLMLGGVSHVLRIRVIAPMAFRLAAVREALELGRDEGLAYIHRQDHDRARWTRYLYGVDWSDPSLYDLVLNLEHVSIAEACEIVCASARKPVFAETDESRAAMADLALSYRVTAALLTTPETSELALEVRAKAGVVTLHGKVRTRKQLEAVAAVVGRTPGVSRTVLDGVVQALDA
jgi:cytidylate kinase